MARTNLIGKYYRLRARYWRLQRLLFMSPAEARFVRLMGGRVLTFRHIRSTKTGFPLTFVLGLGRSLRAQQFRREVRVGKYYVDFANDIGWCIEIDGSEWHRDVVAEFERESYLYQRGCRILRIKAPRLWNDSAGVQRDVLKFLAE